MIISIARFFVTLVLAVVIALMLAAFVSRDGLAIIAAFLIVNWAEKHLGW